MLIYDRKKDYVENGSGIVQYLDNLSFTSKNMAILMMIVSDNIATNKMIEYLGFDSINNTIKDMGFNNTELIAKKLDFDIYNSIGKTTAYEYAKLYKMLLNKEILAPDLCDEIIEILSHQIKNEMLNGYFYADNTASVLVYESNNIEGNRQLVVKIGKIVYEYLKNDFVK